MIKRTAIKELFFGPAKNASVEFFRSLFVGGVAFLADTGILVTLKEALGFGVVAASMLGFAAGVAVNYVMSNYWAFRSSNVKNQFLRIAIFVVIALLGMALNSGILWVFEFPLAEKEAFGRLLQTRYYYIAGKIVSTVMVFFWNFFSRKLLLYRAP